MDRLNEDASYWFTRADHKLRKLLLFRTSEQDI
jgi:hypothetical protein